MRRRDWLKAAGGSLALPGTLALAQGPALPANQPYDWQSVPFGGGGFVDGFVFHPRERGLLYARTDIGGAYRFEPAQQRWLPLLDHLGKDEADLMGVLSLAVDPKAPQRLYAACGLYVGAWTRAAALLASDDRGVNWRQHELGFKLGGNEPGRGTGERLQVDPQHGDVLWLGSTQDGLWRSEDRGRNFRRLPWSVRHVSLVLIDPRSSGAPGQACRTLYAGSHDQPGLYRSDDGGERFVRISELPAQVPQRAVFAPNGSLYVSFALGDEPYATNPGNARNGSVWMRRPGGAWTEITPLRPSGGRGFGYSGLDVDARVPGRLMVSTIERWSEGDEIFLSVDDGANWTALGPRSRHDASSHPWLQNYLRGQESMGHWIADLKIDPFDSERAIYGTGYGLWISDQLSPALTPGDIRPLRWQFAVANFEETATLELKSPSGGATLLAAMGDVSGAAWDDLSKGPDAGLFRPSHETCRSVDSAELAPGIVARTSDHAATGGYWSRDGGASWQPFASAPQGTRERRARAPSGSIAVSAKGGFFVCVPEKQAALHSRDRGRSWGQSQGWPLDREVVLQPVADRSVEGVFYVHDRAGGQILMSVDGGQSFKPAIVDLPRLASWQSSQLLCASGRPRDLWLVLHDQLLHFPGVDQPLQNFSAVREAWMIALGKGAPDAAAAHSIYVWGRVQTAAGLSEGLFRSDDGGQQFLRINEDRQRWGRLLSMSADPLEHGSLFVAPHGRGVLVGRPRKVG